MPATAVNSDVLDRWLRGCAAAIAEQRDYLTQLDAAIGDADHGANMTRGFAAVQDKLDDLDGGTPPGKLLIAAGSTLVSTVGGASGPLWGSGLRKAGRSLGDAEQIEPEALVDALEAALGAIVELGAAELGDKTMVDALAPAIESMRSSLGEWEHARGRPRRAHGRQPRRGCARRFRWSRARDAPPTLASARSGTRIPGRRRSRSSSRRSSARSHEAP